MTNRFRMPSASIALADRPGVPAAERAEIEERFFRGLRLENGTYKTTKAQRLADIDEYVAGLVPRAGPLEVLDVGISSGVTTANLLERLRAENGDLKAMVTDITLFGRIHSAGGFSALSASNGFVLQVSIGSTGRGRPHDPRRSLRRGVADLAIRWSGGIARLLDRSPRNVLLISSALRQQSGVAFHEGSVFHLEESWQSRFWLVRGANILNREYFPERDLKIGVAHLASYVSDSGYLLLNRTADPLPRNDGTLLKKLPGGAWRIEKRFGNGSEVEDLLRPS
jgi:hypothetical protein